MNEGAPPLPSATVVLLRDAAPGLELLLLQRAPREDGRPGPWVFPGGKVDSADHAPDASDTEAVARRAAVRETHEEAGLAVRESGLTVISRWITPPVSPRRFDTWFFLGEVEAEAEVRVDGSEIAHHRWLSPADVLEAYREKALKLAPPTFVTVTWLEDFATPAEASRVLGESELVTFRPQIHPGETGACILYPGDAGYEAKDPARTGPRHRLWATPEGYRYERSR